MGWDTGRGGIWDVGWDEMGYGMTYKVGEDVGCEVG